MLSDYSETLLLPWLLLLVGLIIVPGACLITELFCFSINIRFLINLILLSFPVCLCHPWSFFNKNLFILIGGLLLYNIVLVLPYIDMNPLQYTCVPHPEPPSQFPPNSIPLGHPSVPAPSTLSHASNLDWRFISHMIIYMFQCHPPKSSHPHPLPQSQKDCSIHLCLFCYLTYRVFITIFLNSI